MSAKKDSHSMYSSEPQIPRIAYKEVVALVVGLAVLTYRGYQEAPPATTHAERLQMLAGDDLDALTATPTPFRGEGTPSATPAANLGGGAGYTR